MRQWDGRQTPDYQGTENFKGSCLIEYNTAKFRVADSVGADNIARTTTVLKHSAHA